MVFGKFLLEDQGKLLLQLLLIILLEFGLWTVDVVYYSILVCFSFYFLFFYYHSTKYVLHTKYFSFIGHSGSVNSVRFHPTKELALTSSGDNYAHVWQAAVDWDLPKRQNSSEDLSCLSSERNLSGITILNEEQEEPPTLR